MTSTFHSVIFNMGALGQYIKGRTSGSYRVATELRRHGWDVEVVDFFYFWTLDELKQLSKSRIGKNTKFIAFSHIFSDWPPLAEELSSWLKETYPDIKIIFGCNAYKNFNTKNIDYYVAGYGELAIIALLEYLFSNGKRPIMTPIDGNKVIEAQKYYAATPWRDPAIFYEDRDFIEPMEWLGIEFSRGCKFKCAYCNFPVLGVKEDYSRHLDNAEHQLRDAYERFGVSKYLISDETFNDRTEKITKIADMIETLDFQPFFASHIRADLLISRPHDKEELLRMNTLFHFYGIESFNYESAKVCGKGMKTERIRQGVIDIKNYFRNHGTGRYRGTIGLIAGLPHETEESVISTINFLNEHWKGENVMLNPLDIYKSSLANVSIFEEKFEEFGYRVMTEVPEEYRDGRRAQAKGPTFTPNSVIWENDYTNWYRIREIVANLRSTFKENFRLACFELSNDFSGKGLDHSLSIGYSQFGGEHQEAFVKRYKQKKLGL
jgi:radical SAM superfamily enzyme YgiQ (UPF0313 family)